ncbi:c-type cytochrome [Paracoccus sp. (in: a-proteobacteria)]|uniref:c-type cytochrome n=1 Tax=Paracoccus sp. TaxID=267 RepID=UPI0026E0796B|nr:c-type cytochrome [Paracoccus sp. (in: a-proteobacteria)]MDO5648206.1 hypothetical protein [Paracoccus sp. (in: a-proteobacteria)]
MNRVMFAMAVGGAALTSPLAAQDIDAATAQVLAGPCASCHGPDGRSPGAIPSIAGMDADEMRTRLMGFRDGSVASTVMGRHMRGYSPEQIDALAQWFSQVQK